jgi:hypothetical protein
VTRSTIDNPLAEVLTATIRELAEARLLHAAERDYTAWLQRELGRARDWSVADVMKAWHEELDRREHGRSQAVGTDTPPSRVTGSGERERAA